MQRLAPVNVSGSRQRRGRDRRGAVAHVRSDQHGRRQVLGLNTNGQLGDNSITQRLTPVNVSRNCQRRDGRLPAAISHTCALVSGGVKCWGLNVNGQVGDNTQTQRLTPVDVTGLTSGVTAIATGASHSCARLAGTGLQCWGDQHAWGARRRHAGRRAASTPVDVVGLTSGVTRDHRRQSTHLRADRRQAR